MGVSDAELAVLRQYTVLYVDDEAPNLDVFDAAFGDRFQVRLAGSAAEALEIIADEPIHVVVTDNRMPDKLGIDLLVELHERLPHIQRVLCTAYSDQQTAIDAINRASVQHYVVKPWDTDEVTQLLRDLLASVHLQQTAARLHTDLVEFEREACMTALRRRLEQDLGNILSVLHAVDVGLRTELAEANGSNDALDLCDDLTGSVTALRRLHSLARSASERRAVQVEEIDVRELLDAALRLVGHELAGKARLSVETPPHGLHVTSDRLALLRVLLRAVMWSADVHRERTHVQIAISHDGDDVDLHVTAQPPLPAALLAAELAEPVDFEADGRATLAVARELAAAAGADLVADGETLVVRVRAR
ncbi:MAG: Hydrogenase transcriptional regulatory protein hupR1 [Pseudomonadota bacterium]|jgi:CheY-like chemotaxis protein